MGLACVQWLWTSVTYSTYSVALATGTSYWIEAMSFYYELPMPLHLVLLKFSTLKPNRAEHVVGPFNIKK